MRRGALPVLAAGLVLAAWWALRLPDPMPGPLRFPACRHLTVTGGGEALRGIEDLALAPGGDALILSAQDRAALSEAREAGAPGPAGGLWRLPLAALGGTTAAADPLAPPPGPFHPHGIAVAADGRLAVVNRIGPGAAQVERGELRGQVLRYGPAEAGDGLCRANDVALPDAADGGVAVTLDRGACGTALADLLPFAWRGRVVLLPGSEAALAGLAFPNGIAVLPAGLAVAETRGERVRLPTGPVAVPGAPDNLNLAPDGTLVVALHPSLLRLALHRAGWLARAPSRIVALDPATGAVTALHDDPAGTLLSGATAAVIAGGWLVAGSATDAGLLVCGGGTA